MLTNFLFKYPKIAEKELMGFNKLSNEKNIPKGEYLIHEMYCTDIDCDCRRVCFCIIWDNGKSYYLDYWFETTSFYKKFFFWDSKLAEEATWLSVNELQWNPAESELMLDTMKEVLNDKKYVKRLKKHYNLMKKNVDWFKELPILDNDEDDDVFFLDKSEADFLSQGSLNSMSTKRTQKEKNKRKLAKKQRKNQRKRKKK